MSYFVKQNISHKKITDCCQLFYLNLAGVVGFEPTHDGFRDRSLTTWRHPTILHVL